MKIEVIDLIFEFLVSLLVIAGGGFLMFMGKGDSTFITSMMALVIYFWFQSRATDKTVQNLYKQPPGIPTQTGTLPLPPSQVIDNAPAPETTNPTNTQGVPDRR